MKKLIGDKFLKNVYLLASLLFVFITIYFNRWIFSFRYDSNYYENYYYHSQWNIPESTRVISDGDLYKFVGFRLAEGGNPFDINYEVPPAAKYLYGLSSKHLNNPYFISFVFYLLSLTVFFFLAKEIFSKTFPLLVAVFLFITSPILVAQIGQTMLDLPQMLWLLLHLYFFITGIKKKRNRTTCLVLSGVFLGLMTGTKIGVYTPLIILVDLAYIFVVLRDLRSIIFFLAGTGGGYLLAFYCYFIKHPNPVVWLRLHKRVFDFYLSSVHSSDLVNQCRTIFINRYQGWWNRGVFNSVDSWSLLWPVGTISIVILLIRSFIKKPSEKSITYLTFIAVSILMVNTFVAFWPRYLLLILPIFVLTAVYIVRNNKFLLVLISVLNLPFLFSTLIPSPQKTAELVAKYLQTDAYAEIYHLSSSETVGEYEFKTTLNRAKADLLILNNQASIKSIDYRKFAKEARVELHTKYETLFGSLEYDKEVFLENKKGQWRLVWQDDIILPNFQRDKQIIADIGPLPVSNIYTKDGVLVAKNGDWPFVTIVPRLIKDWQTTLIALGAINDRPDNWDLIKRVVPDEYPIAIGFAKLDFKKQDLELLKNLPGVGVKQLPYVVVLDEYCLQKELIEAIDEYIADNHSIFLPTGEIVIADQFGRKLSTLINNNPILTSKSIYLEKTLKEILVAGDK